MELSANAGNRTGDRTFKQDPRGRLHYSHGSSSTSMLSPHPAVRDAILACRCQFVPLLPSVFVSDAFHLSPSFSILHPGPNPLPFQNGALDFQIIEGNSRKDRGEITSFHLFPLLPTIFFSLTTLVILPSLYRYLRLANGVSKIESARSVFSYPFPTHGSVLDLEKPIVDVTQGGHRAGCRRATCPFIIDANSSSETRVLGHRSVLSR